MQTTLGKSRRFLFRARLFRRGAKIFNSFWQTLEEFNFSHNIRISDQILISIGTSVKS